MPFSPAALLTSIRTHLPAPASGRLCIAFSGGLDSTVLLHALAAAIREQPPGVYVLRAVHIDHQLQLCSADWRRYCAELAAQAGIDFGFQQVHVPPDSSMGIEAAARTVRYQALRSLIEPGEALLTAHHADDQLETVLLALTRGAGTGGLSAMPACQIFGAGWHLRPLLEFTRAELEEWARAQGLSWISDPSNEDSRFSRNYLRHEIIPALRQRWPGIAHSAVRSAGHLGEAGVLLDALAASDHATAAIGPCLRVDSLAMLDGPRRRNLLRYWLRLRGARLPSTRKLLSLEHDMLMAQEDRLPCVEWDGFEVRRHRGLLYAAAQLPLAQPQDTVVEWDWSRDLVLPDDLGLLSMRGVRGTGLSRAKLPPHLHVAFRHGGESLQTAGRDHHRKLKKLMQDADILPWWRSRVPLLHAGDELVAVGDLWIAQEFAARGDEEGMRIVWHGRPPIAAVAAADVNRVDGPQKAPP